MFVEAREGEFVGGMPDPGDLAPVGSQDSGAFGIYRGGGHFGRCSEALEDGEGHSHLAEIVQMDAVYRQRFR